MFQALCLSRLPRLSNTNKALPFSLILTSKVCILQQNSQIMGTYLFHHIQGHLAFAVSLLECGEQRYIKAINICGTWPKWIIYYWSLLYSAILRSWADSLHSHVILHEWIAFYSAFLNIHRGGVLTALAWLVTQESAARESQSRRVLCTPYNHAPCHFMQSHIRKVYACLAVTCHLRFWQNDRGLLRATAVTRGWNGYRNKSTESWPWRRKLSRRSSRDSNPRPFDHESGALTTELSPLPVISSTDRSQLRVLKLRAYGMMGQNWQIPASNVLLLKNDLQIIQIIFRKKKRKKKQKKKLTGRKSHETKERNTTPTEEVQYSSEWYIDQP